MVHSARKTIKLESAGSVIRALREERELTLEAVAARIGWDKSRLSRYETDRVALSVAALQQIAQGLEMPPLLVLVACLRRAYPQLSGGSSRARRLLDELEQALQAEARR